MDQHIISWLGLQETGRHNVVTEKETGRHNKEMERLEQRKIWASESNARTAAQAQTTAALYARQGTETAARLNADAHRFAATTSADASRYNTGMRYLETLMSTGVERSRIAMQSRYNQSSLALSARQLAETTRSNRAREAENIASREQQHYFSTWEQMRKDEELKWNKFSFYDSLHQRQSEERTGIHKEYLRGLYTLGSSLIRAMGVGGYTMKGGTSYVQEEGQAIFDRIDEGLRREGR